MLLVLFLIMMLELLIIEEIYYIDPGTSSFLLQAFLAASATVAVYFKNILLFIKKFRKKK
jgi:hypothetical protein